MCARVAMVEMGQYLCMLGRVVLGASALHLAALGKNTVPAMKRSCLRQCERGLVRGLLQRPAGRFFRKGRKTWKVIVWYQEEGYGLGFRLV